MSWQTFSGYTGRSTQWCCHCCGRSSPANPRHASCRRDTNARKTEVHTGPVEAGVQREVQRASPRGVRKSRARTGTRNRREKTEHARLQWVLFTLSTGLYRQCTFPSHPSSIQEAWWKFSICCFCCCFKCEHFSWQQFFPFVVLRHADLYNVAPHRSVWGLVSFWCPWRLIHHGSFSLQLTETRTSSSRVTETQLKFSRTSFPLMVLLLLLVATLLNLGAAAVPTAKRKPQVLQLSRRNLPSAEKTVVQNRINPGKHRKWRLPSRKWPVLWRVQSRKGAVKKQKWIPRLDQSRESYVRVQTVARWKRSPGCTKSVRGVFSFWLLWYHIHALNKNQNNFLPFQVQNWRCKEGEILLRTWMSRFVSFRFSDAKHLFWPIVCVAHQTTNHHSACFGFLFFWAKICCYFDCVCVVVFIYLFFSFCRALLPLQHLHMCLSVDTLFPA